MPSSFGGSRFLGTVVLWALWAWAACMAGCGGSDHPLDQGLAKGKISAIVGPAGKTLRGRGGSDLEGFVLRIPAGALDELVEITITTGEPIELPATVAASVPVRLDVRPDPGVLRRPATVRMRVSAPEFRASADFVTATRVRAPVPAGVAEPLERVGVLAVDGARDLAARAFTSTISRLGDLQIRITNRPRQPQDAGELVNRAFAELERFTDGSLPRADLLFAEALTADPFDAAAAFFRAITRLLVVANDRRDDGPGLDSVGEALTALGLNVRRRSLVQRLRARDWPPRLVAPRPAPRVGDLVALLRERVRPALLLSIDDLARVPPGMVILFRMPAVLGVLPGDREADATDVLLLRALFAAGVFAIDVLEDLDLETDLARLTDPTRPIRSVQEFLAAHPSFGALRSRPEKRTVQAFAEALSALTQGYASLIAETDPQQNDLFVLRRSFTPDRRERWRANLVDLWRSFVEPVATTIRLDGGAGALAVDLRSPFTAGVLDPRAQAPRFAHDLPLAGTLPDPQFGGLLPGMTEDRAADLFALVSRHTRPSLSVVADGRVDEWSAASEALLPRDPTGDTGSSVVRGVDLRAVWLADSGDDLALRLSVADGEVRYRPSQPTVYEILLDDVGVPTAERVRLRVRIEPAASGTMVRVWRNGRALVVRHSVGAAKGELELTLRRFDLREPDEPIKDRLLRVRSEALDVASGRRGADRTRAILIRF